MSSLGFIVLATLLVVGAVVVIALVSMWSEHE